MTGWEIGLVVAVAIPVVVFAGAIVWPQPNPKKKSPNAIGERAQRERRR